MTDPQRAEAEAEAIRQRYARRAANAEQHQLLARDVIYRAQAVERAVAQLICDHDLPPLADKAVLEIGCGEGIHLLQLIRLGFNPALMVGNDLREDALRAARAILPSTVRFVAGEASAAELGRGQFDVVTQSTVFSSILDADVQRGVADRMWAAVKPGGGVLWYDLAFDNPWNPDVRGVPLSRIRGLFPDGVVDARRVTLAPPIARRVAPVAPALYAALDAIPWLRSHLLCWIAKPS